MTIIHHIIKVMVVKRRVEKKQIETKQGMNKVETNQVVSSQDELNMVVRWYVDRTLDDLGPDLGSLWDQFRQEDIRSKMDFKQSIKSLFKCYCLEWNLNCLTNERFIIVTSNVCPEVGFSVFEMDVLEEELTSNFSFEWSRIYVMSVLTNLDKFRQSPTCKWWVQKYSNIGLHPKYEQFIMDIDVSFIELTDKRMTSSEMKMKLYSDDSVSLFLTKMYLGMIVSLRFVDCQVNQFKTDQTTLEPIDFHNHLSKLDLTKYGLSGVGFEWTE